MPVGVSETLHPWSRHGTYSLSSDGKVAGFLAVLAVTLQPGHRRGRAVGGTQKEVCRSLLVCPHAPAG